MAEPTNDRVLINGKVQLTLSEFYKFGIPMVGLLVGGIFTYAKVENNITQNAEDIANIFRMAEQRAPYIERLVRLEQEVVRVNERAISGIANENRVLQQQLSAIIARLDRIETVLIPHVSP